MRSRVAQIQASCVPTGLHPYRESRRRSGVVGGPCEDAVSTVCGHGSKTHDMDSVLDTAAAGMAKTQWEHVPARLYRE